MGRLLVAMLAVATLPATSLASPPTPLRCDGAAPPSPPRAIADVAWCSLDGVAWKGPLVRGRSEVHLYSDLGQPHDTISTRIASVDLADLDGDRRPEAFVVIERSTWIADREQPSVGSDLAVYAWRRGALVRLATLPAGTPITDLTIRRGVIAMVSGPDAAPTRHRWSRRTRTFTELPTAP